MGSGPGTVVERNSVRMHFLCTIHEVATPIDITGRGGMSLCHAPARNTRCIQILSTMARQQRHQGLHSLRSNPDIARFVTEGEANGRQLGTGSYGSVEEVGLVWSS